MLRLKKIVKTYTMGDQYVDALKGVDIDFRKSEFVSILGPSGCGKTTLLNIVGGLDQYTSGDLVINGKSTKNFTDRDWDTYRNHSVGFVFQSYNLIPHQNVLANVELALTLSGVSKSERRQRAVEALKKVGLGDQLTKKPNQLSGGQMQRVAIARALVNDPEILLADEPTGALDSETSVQVMELLKEIAHDRLVIMVTHNPELAEQYSTRIIRLLDGNLIDDTNPYLDEEPEMTEPKKKTKEKKKKPSMSFFTALSLSLNNLMTKKGRTILTSFAGSIGIIGIALVLSVATGVNAYIASIEKNMMSSYPLTVMETTMDTNTVIASLITGGAKPDAEREENTVYANTIMLNMIKSMSSGVRKNDLASLKTHLEKPETNLQEYILDVKYSYGTALNPYLVSGDTFVKGLEGFGDIYAMMGMEMEGMEQMDQMNAANIWMQLIGDADCIASQYDVLYGHLPTNKFEVVLIVDEYNQVSDYTLYCLGLMDVDGLKTYLEKAQESMLTGKEFDMELPTKTFTYEELCATSYRLLLDSDYYTLTDRGLVRDATEDEINARLEHAAEVKIVGIVKAGDDSLVSSGAGCIGYIGELMTEMIARANESDVVKAQLDHPETDVFTGLSFEKKTYTVEEIRAFMLASEEYAKYASLPDEMLLNLASQMMSTSATYAGNLAKMGHVDFDSPSAISFYAKDFDSKEVIKDILDAYNEGKEESETIAYSDTIGEMIKSVSTIIDVISGVLIGFVAVSLVVSSIMIGIITYISVLERTKEIGILRAIGASKKDISRVFNAETTIVGLISGIFGIGITLILNLLINVILHAATTAVPGLNATLPVQGAIILVIISIALTFIAGLIPSGIASKKDPVIALRSE
ncbi:MAG: ABC transporter ATP-binding protein/permease [Clostridia bacterium]|nr:ABC transporter ATP-binding protein/permease [Clostridia bacterium]